MGLLCALSVAFYSLGTVLALAGSDHGRMSAPKSQLAEHAVTPFAPVARPEEHERLVARQHARRLRSGAIGPQPDRSWLCDTINSELRRSRTKAHIMVVPSGNCSSFAVSARTLTPCRRISGRPTWQVAKPTRRIMPRAAVGVEAGSFDRLVLPIGFKPAAQRPWPSWRSSASMTASELQGPKLVAHAAS